MDLNSRVDRIDEEMKLLKNEIKQVLLEVQEHVLNAQNPFTTQGAFPKSSITNNAPAQPTGGYAGGMGGGGFIGGGMVSGGGSVGVVEPIAAPVESAAPNSTQSPTQGMADQVSNQPKASVGNIPPGTPSEHESDGPSLGPDLSSSPFDLDADGPSIGPGDPDTDGEFDDFADFGGESFRETPRNRARATRANGAVIRSNQRNRPIEDVEEVTTKSERNSKEKTGRRENKDRRLAMDSVDLDEIGNMGASSIDLITIAGLAQWCDRALKKIGRENLETLVQVSELTGRVSKETKDILMTILPLFDGKKDDVISAKEIVSLLAQLDGLLEGGPSKDNRLLPFILQDDMEFFPFMLQ